MTKRDNHVKKLPTTTKECLKCRKEFGSTGKGNRLCRDCNERNIIVSRIETQTQGSRSNGVKGITNS